MKVSQGAGDLKPLIIPLALQINNRHHVPDGYHYPFCLNRCPQSHPARAGLDHPSEFMWLLRCGLAASGHDDHRERRVLPKQIVKRQKSHQLMPRTAARCFYRARTLRFV